MPRDYCVEYSGHYYSVPHDLIDQKVDLFTTSSALDVYFRGNKITLHSLSDIHGGYSFIPEHRPKNHKAYISGKDWHFHIWG